MEKLKDYVFKYTLYIFIIFIIYMHNIYYIYIYISVVLYSLTPATLMSPGKDETRVCIYIYMCTEKSHKIQ